MLFYSGSSIGCGSERSGPAL